MGCFVERADLENHAACHRRVAAHRAGVHHLGVPGDARPGHSPTRHRVGGTVLMWYFACILGLALACSVGILNAIWYEVHSDWAHGRTVPLKRSDVRLFGRECVSTCWDRGRLQLSKK